MKKVLQVSKDEVMPKLKPIKLFYVYSEKDVALAEELETHLALLMKQGVIESWHPGRLLPGSETDVEIAKYLDNADIILLLISADFMASYSCYDIQMLRAMERHENHSALVMPIMLRPADCTGAPFSSLQFLPREASPIVMHTNHDLVWSEIAKSIRMAAFARFILREYRPTRFIPVGITTSIILLIIAVLYLVKYFWK